MAASRLHCILLVVTFVSPSLEGFRHLAAAGSEVEGRIDGALRHRRADTTCGVACGENSECIDSVCRCQSGWAGLNCSLFTCQCETSLQVCIGPNQCSAVAGEGIQVEIVAPLVVLSSLIFIVVIVLIVLVIVTLYLKRKVRRRQEETERDYAIRRH